jgi:HEPN domain-containing protein
VAHTPLYRKDFKILAELRAAEAGVLATRGKQHGAYYLAGYAVECALKACIARKTKRYEFPPPANVTRDVYTHDLTLLLRQAGLEDQLTQDMRANPALAANWNAVKGRNEMTRYVTTGLNGRDFYKAVAGADGVLPWIKQRW